MFSLKKVLAVGVLSVASISAVSANEWVLDSFDGYNGNNANAAIAGGNNDGFLSLVAEGNTGFAQDTEVSPHGIVTATLLQSGGAVVPQASGATAFATVGSSSNLIYNQDTNVSGNLGLFYSNPAANIQDPSTFLDLSGQGEAFYFDVTSIDTSFVLDLYVISDTSIFGANDNTDANNNGIPDVTETFFANLYAGGTGINTAAISGLEHSFAQISVPNGFVSPGRITSSFDSFSGNADFGAVTGIFAVLTGATAADLAIDEVGVVPEPATLALFGLGLLGLGVARRRKI